MVFVFGSVYVMDYVYRFAYVEPGLHPWNEAYLFMKGKLFDVLLHSVCQYFIEDFCSYVHHGYWPQALFCSCVSARLGNRMMLVSENELGIISYFILFGIISEGMVLAPLSMSGRIQL